MKDKSWCKKMLEESADLKKENSDLRVRIYNISSLCAKSVDLKPENQVLYEILRHCKLPIYDDIPY